jgi:hypothetical protein
MSKPYWSGQGGRTGSSYVDEHDDAPTRRISSYDTGDHGAGYNNGFYSSGGYRSTEEYRSSVRAHDDVEDDDFEDYEYYERDLRWRWVAGLAVAVLLVAVIAIAVVMRGDGDTQTAQTETPPATSTAPRTVIATIPPSPVEPPPAQLSPETVVTITTTPSAVTAPPPEVAPAPAPVAAPPAPAPVVDPRTVTYSVTGTKQMFDLVSVIYTDEQGLPRTDVNVALPWSKTLVLEPGVDFESVTATSITGQLNCAITDAAGATLVAQTNNTMIATCTG